MNIHSYGRVNTDSRKSKNKKLIGIIIILVILLSGVGAVGVLTDDGAEYQARLSAIEENHKLSEENANLREENARLKKELKEKTNYIDNLPEQDEDDEPTPSPSQPTTPRN